MRVTESVRRASDATVAPLRRVEAISSSYGALLPLLGVAIMVGVWVYGGTAGWASGMFVTPVEAVQPIVEIRRCLLESRGKQRCGQRFAGS